MTTYTCKCGKTFTKNTEAGTTGFRMPDYGPEHECFGCPFVCNITTWDPTAQTNAVQNHECRGSKSIRYDTTISLNSTDKTVATIYTLDFEFLRLVHEFAETLEGFEPDQHFFDNRSASYDSDGRFRYTLYPMQNHNGISAKIALNLHFFNSDGVRRDVTPEQEKEIIISQIKEAKTMNSYYAPCGHKFSRSAGGVSEVTIEVTGTTQDCFTCSHALHEQETDEHGPKISCVCGRKKVDPADTPITFEEAADKTDSNSDTDSFVGTKYQHIGKVYVVKPCEGEKYRTFFHYAVDPSEAIPCGNIPKCDTPEIAQKMLDDYATKHEYEAFIEPTSEAESPLTSDLSSDDIPAEAAGEPDDSGLAEQPEQDDIPDSENDQDDNSTDSCDWKNASGADEDEDEGEVVVDKSQEREISGVALSLQDDIFLEMMAKANASLCELAGSLIIGRQREGDVTIKLTLLNDNGNLDFKYAVTGVPKPTKVTRKGESYESIQIVIDKYGNPMIPYDREHQINFDEIQSGRVIPPSPVTTTVDGNTGLVEDVQIDAEDQELNPEDGSNGDDAPVTNEFSEENPLLIPCDHQDCPFYGTADDGSSGCLFDTESKDDINFAGDVWTAVNMENCQRIAVLEAYRKNNPEDDYDGSDQPDETDDLPFDMQNNYEEDSAS